MHSKLILLAFLTFAFLINGFAKEFYVDSSLGSDTNDGLSAAKAWKTLAKVSAFSFSEGDQILFRSGDIFYGKIALKGNGTTGNPITIGKYGAGSKPEIRNAKAIAQWESTPNGTWSSRNAALNCDQGAVFILNSAGSIVQSIWQKRKTMNDVSSTGDFWGDGTSANGYFVSVKTLSNLNPIEIAGQEGQVLVLLHDNSINLAGNKNIVIDGLSIRFGGSHGLSISEGAQNIVVRNCDFSYLGGCEIYKGYNGRYGNAIEIWGSADGVLIEKNKMWELFDTGYTNQYQGDKPQIQRNIVFRNNLVSKVGFSGIESWCSSTTGNGLMENIFIENNTLVDAGIGCWACDQENRRKYYPNTGKLGAHFSFLGNNARVSNFYFRNNILCNSFDMAVFVNPEFNNGSSTANGFSQIFGANNMYFDEHKIQTATRILFDMKTTNTQNPGGMSYYAGNMLKFQEMYPRQTGNFYGNPKFWNAELADFSISKLSSGYTKGINLSEKTNYPEGTDFSFKVDLKSIDRLTDGTMDIGAYDVEIPASSSDVNSPSGSRYLQAFPSPFFENLTLRAKYQTSKTELQYAVYHSSGILMQKGLWPKLTNSVSFPTAKWPTGIYVLVVSTENNRTTDNQILIK